MTLVRAFDAAVPPHAAPPGCAIAMGYLGRPGFTPHVWTAPEWNRFTALGLLPFWVPDLTVDPRHEARLADTAAKALGWESALDHPIPAGETRAIIFDFETASSPRDAAWWAEASDQLHVDGFVGVAYGSESTVFTLAASWVHLAAWDGLQQLGEGQTVVAHQYQSEADVDFSVVSPWLAARCSRGPRRG